MPRQVPSGSSENRYGTGRGGRTVTQMTVPALDIRLLGPPQVLVKGSPLHVDTRKALAILALLAAERRAFARTELAAMLWPDGDDESARGALRRTLSTLRAAVDTDGFEVDRTTVGLDRSRIRVDLDDLERLAGSNDADDLSEAAAIARGPFLAGFNLRDSPDFDDWRAARATSVDRTVASVLDRLSLAREHVGDLIGARQAAERRVEVDTLDESAHVRLMEVLAASGDRAAALRQYRVCVAILNRELAVVPLPETTARYEAIRDATPPPPPSAITPIDPARDERLPMVGREEALAAITRAREAARRDGQVVALVGEAGIGKTRLAEAATADVRRAGGTVVATRAYEAERAIPYGPVVELLRAGMADPEARRRLEAMDPAARSTLSRLLPDLQRGARRGGTDEGPAAHARLVSAIADALAAMMAGMSPGMVWLDDIQWADNATLEALSYTLRRLPSRPLVLLLTWRREDLDEGALAFADLIEAFQAVTMPRLDRLDRQAVAALVAAAGRGEEADAGTVDELMRASEGLPLYVVEALAPGAQAGGGMPRGVRAVLRQRLTSIDGATSQVLAAAALIGRSFDLSTVRHASGRSEDETVVALDQLAQRGMIRELPGGEGPAVRFDFSHSALRDLAEESTSLARRLLLHRRIAEAFRLDLAGIGRDDLGRLVQIAQHEREARRDAEAALAFRDAGDRAATLYANREAIAHYEAALALGHPEVVSLHAGIGGLRTRLGDYVGAIASLEAAAALARPSEQAALELALVRAQIRRGDLVAADRHLDAGLLSTDDPSLRSMLLVHRSILRRRAGDSQAAEEAALGALAAAGVDPAAAGSAHRMIGLVALDRNDPVAAHESLELARIAATTDEDPTALIAALVGLALAEAALGSADAMLTHAQEAVSACRLIGDRHLEAAVENHIADLLHARGRDDEAWPHQRRAVEAFAEVGGIPADPDPGIWMLAAW
jgi:DNA-binding SARP family transcriptional activator/tetratricopeptide (TPR) repeat protein